MNIVCFGQQNWDLTWTEKQQHMTRLVRRGHRVLYIDPTWSHQVSTTADRLRSLAPIRSGLGLREVVPGALWVYTHHFAPPLRWRWNQHRYPHVLRRLIAKLHFPAPVAVAFRPDAALDAVRPEAIVYYAVDEQTAYGGISPEWQRRIRAMEERVLRRSDVALGVSPRLVRRFRELQPRSYVLENGVDPEHFAPERLARLEGLPEIRALPPGPRLGFVGQIDERIDQLLLLHLAQNRPEWQLVLVGRVKEGTDVSLLRERPNVHFIPFQSYEALPRVLREFQVCLVPYRRTELTDSCNPAKIFEYVATGLPVVSTPLDGIRACREVVLLAHTPPAFLAAVEAALTEPEAGYERRLEVAAESHWEHRVDEMERRLEEARAVASERRPAVPPERWSIPSRRIAALPGPPERWQEHGWRADGAVFPSWVSRLAWEGFRAAGLVSYGVRLMGRLVRSERPLAVRSILVVRRTYLGDTIVFLPTLAALRACFPHARIVLGVQPGMSAGALVEGTGFVDEIRVLDFLSRPSLAGRLAGAARLWAEGFDVTISGLGCFLLGEAFYAGSPRRIGLYDGHPRQRLNTRVVPQDITVHEAENNLALVELLSGAPVDPTLVPELVLDPVATRDGAAHLLAELGIPPHAEVLVVHPGAKRASRRWPAERFAALVELLLRDRPEMRVVFSGVPAEASLVMEIQAAVPASLRDRALSSLGRTDLPTLVGLLDRSAAVVSNDTGTLHLARARGAPLLALLGPESHRRWGPHPVGPAPAIALRNEVPCAPCSREACDLHVCMRSLPVDQAAAEVRRLLDAGWSAPTDGDAVAVTPHIRQRSWASLAREGFELPLVSIVVFGREDGTLRLALVDAELQDYPRLEVIVATDHPAAEGGAAGGAVGLAVRHVRVGTDDPEQTWHAVLHAAGGEFLTLWAPGARWESGRLSADVAALVRDPGAVTAAGSMFPRVAPPPGPPTIRRSALEALLERAPGADPSSPTARSLAGWLAATSLYTMHG